MTTFKSQASPPVIELKGIRKDYKSSGGITTHALHDVDLSIRSGDFVAIMGPSGSGKSTLMHILGLLDRHFQGMYRLNGQDVTRLSSNRAAEIRNQSIGFVFQQFNLLKRTSVLHNVLLPTTYHAQANDEVRALKVIDQVGLTSFVKKQGNQLSGGQIQRVAIARALVMQPSLVLADEPTGNLDSKTSHEIMELFQEINQQGTTIVLITHEDDVAKYAKRILRMHDGKIRTAVHV